MNIQEKIIESVARVCHEANRAYCLSIGDASQAPWDEAPDWQKASALNGVKFVIDHPQCVPSDSHAEWMKQKWKDGWKYGPVKDEIKKEHPCMVAYEDLPGPQISKDYIFLGICRSMLSL